LAEKPLPRHLYRDVLVGLQTERRLNNGQPSFLAALLRASAMSAGDHVVHLGCGTGYYSAVIAELVGPDGRVTAIEADPELAARAIEGLADWPQVQARCGDAAIDAFDPADVVLVNFGMTHPLPRWVQQLKPGGRLLVPITAANAIGTVICFVRRADGIAAQPLGATHIFSSVSARDPEREAKLQQCFADGPTAGFAVASLRLDPHAEEQSCWLHGEGSCLSTRPLEPRAPLDDYTGTYDTPDAGTIVFSVRRGALFSESRAGKGALVARGADRFDVPGLARLCFERDTEGRVTAVAITLAAQRLVARRVD